MPQSVYIHIPFCKRKCNYCAFTSITDINSVAAYLEALKREIKTFYCGEALNTLYFGGGTPSLLSADQVQGLVDMFNTTEKTEITLEANPDSADEKFLNGIKNCGVNRLSIGIQSFDDKTLRTIGRLHDSKQAMNAVETAKNEGFTNISTDFIYGLPSQQLEGFISDLKKAVESGVSHISLYGLKIEENTPFYRNTPDNIADADLQADMYLAAIELLEKESFLHYEISNFSKPAFESKHNLNYWNCGEYYGFGVSAHGYTNGVRCANKSNVEDYIKNPVKKLSTRTLSEQAKIEEAVFLGFRRGCGIDYKEFYEKFGIDFKKKYGALLKKYADFFVATDKNCRFTPNGFLVSNSILADFLEI